MSAPTFTVRAYVDAAKMAREFARSHRRDYRQTFLLKREREQAEKRAREAFMRAYGYLNEARKARSITKPERKVTI